MTARPAAGRKQSKTGETKRESVVVIRGAPGGYIGLVDGQMEGREQ